MVKDAANVPERKLYAKNISCLTLWSSKFSGGGGGGGRVVLIIPCGASTSFTTFIKEPPYEKSCLRPWSSGINKNGTHNAQQ